MRGQRVSIVVAVAVALFLLSCYFALHGAAAADDLVKPERVYGMAQRNDAAATAAFESIVPVLHHPRCMNCHSSGDFPRQGDDGHPHAMDVRRGPVGHGVTAQKCSTCHQEHNLAGLHMPPGAPDWHLPSPKLPMIWEGLDDHQLCELLKDRKQNGNRTVAQIIEHMSSPLVLWGWNPGEGRTPIRMSHAEFVAKMKEWAAKGAACPAGTSAAQPDSTARGNVNQ